MFGYYYVYMHTMKKLHKYTCIYIYIYINSNIVKYIYHKYQKNYPNYLSKKDWNATKQMECGTVTTYRITSLFPEIQANPKPSMSNAKICRAPKMLPNVTWAKACRTKTKKGSGKIKNKGKQNTGKEKQNGLA